MNRNNSNENKTILTIFVGLLLFLMFTIICVIYYYFVQENKIIEIIVNMRNNSNE